MPFLATARAGVVSLSLLTGCAGEDPASLLVAPVPAHALWRGATSPSVGARSSVPADPAINWRHVMSPSEAAALRGARGVRVRTREACAGYTLIAPLASRSVHLVDLDGAVVHTWETGLAPGGACTLLDDGSLLHAGRPERAQHFRGGSIGGVIRKLAPDGSEVWRYEVDDALRCQHHDVEPLPNGDLLVVAWERITRDEALALGRRPDGVGAPGLWPDVLLQIRPSGTAGGMVVWEWRARDHLVQDVDPALPNYGVPADHPGRIDVNFDLRSAPPSVDDAELAAERQRQMAALGYGGDDTPVAARPRRAHARMDRERTGDWLHTNAVAYDAAHDLIALSSPELCEVFVIDHSTTTAEAASSSGGRRGKGGALLWRWGNPARHGAGDERDQRLFRQHDPSWLAPTASGALRLLVFNNGSERPFEDDRSAVLELELPFERARGFLVPERGPHGPARPVWRFEDPTRFFSAFVSGAQRLQNGNTLVCSGAAGRVFEVEANGQVVWEYLNPLEGDVVAPPHAGKAPPHALFRAERYAPDHPGVVALISARVR